MKEKEKENKSTTYSGDSIASKWLSGTWLGNLLGYGNNSYTDGYGTTRQYAPLNESAQGQQLKRMGDTAKDTGKLILTGASFMNPAAAGSTAASLLGTGAQAYFMTEGLRDAYNRYMNPNKTAGDAVWTGLDLLGAVPAARGLMTNGRSLFPEIKKSLDTQARITARQYSDYQPTSVLTNVGKGEPTKPFNYLWDDTIPLDATTHSRFRNMEDATTKGLMEAYDIFSSPNIRKSQELNTQNYGRYHIDDLDPFGITPKRTSSESFSSGSVWPGNIVFHDFGETAHLGATEAYQHPYFSEETISTPVLQRPFKGLKIYLRPNKNLEELKNTIKHENFHANCIGAGINSDFDVNIWPVLLGTSKENYLSTLNKRTAAQFNYISNPPEMAAWSQVQFKPYHGVKPGQSVPSTEKEWKQFYKNLNKNLEKAKVGNTNEDYGFQLMFTPILKRRQEITNPSELKSFDETLFSLLNGTAY